MGLVTAFSPGPAVSRSHLAVGIYCLMLEMRRRTSEMHRLGGPEWAGALGAQRSASAALEAWLGLPTVPRSCARVGLKCTCKPVATTVSLGQRTDRGLQYCTGYEMSASLKKTKITVALGDSLAANPSLSRTWPWPQGSYGAPRLWSGWALVPALR